MVTPPCSLCTEVRKVYVVNGKPLSRLRELDALRGLAALGVLVFHYTTRYDNLYGYPQRVADFRWGEYGVQLFFIISGFVIFMSLERVRSPWDFIVSRASRLYPVYWAAVIFTFAITATFGLPGLENHWWEALVNLMMLQRLFGVPHVDDVYWTLTVELAFYALMWIALVSGQLKRIELWGTFWLALMLSYETLQRTTNFALPGPAANFLLLEHGNLFFAGILFYRVFKGTASRYVPLLIGICLTLQFYVTALELGLVTSGFFVTFIFFLKGWLKVLVIPPLLFLGSISYSLYVLHQNVGYVVMRELYALEVTLPAWFILGVPVLFSLVLAAIFTFYIERPALEAIRNRYRKGSPPSPSLHSAGTP